MDLFIAFERDRDVLGCLMLDALSACLHLVDLFGIQCLPFNKKISDRVTAETVANHRMDPSSISCRTEAFTNDHSDLIKLKLKHNPWDNSRDLIVYKRETLTI
jgi:hypothetical protein